MKNIAVYCSSSDALPQKYNDLAIDLGSQMVQNNYDLVWGGADVGLMGILADSVKESGGKVFGYLPEALREKDIAYKEADELVYTKDLRDRKAQMEARADALIALPGGFGTLEETLEMLILKQIKLHNKPIIFLNIDNFFDPLLELFQNMYDLKVAKKEYKDLYYVATDSTDAMQYLKTYVPPQLPDKWFKKK